MNANPLTEPKPTSVSDKRSLASSLATKLRLPEKYLLFSPDPSLLAIPISIILHGILLLAPTPSEQKPIPPETQKQVRISKLPAVPPSPKAKAPSQPAPPPKKALPTPQPKPVNSSQIVIPPKPKTETPPPAPKPKTEASPPEAKPKTESPSPENKPKNELSSQSQTPSEAEPKPAPATGENPWADFPRYPESKPGCFQLESCFQTGQPLDRVASFFEQELPTRKYEAKPTIQEPNRKVYQVSKNGSSQFLSLLFAGTEGTVYVLGPEPLDLNRLKGAVEVPPEVTQILTGLDPQTADPSAFAQPNLFYGQDAKPIAGISNISAIADQTADTLMDAFLRTNLRNNNFEVIEPPKQYAGGALYEVVKEGSKLYVNLIPTRDGTGTLVVIWGSPPV